MRHVKLNTLPTFAVAALILAGCGTLATARDQRQKQYANAEGASQALFKAARDNDEKMLLEILGPEAKKIIASGDAAEDAEARTRFVEKFQEMHRFVLEPDGSTTLTIGAENWPTPIPLRDKDGAWTFDTEAAKREILLRRIGRNEISTIQVCAELAQAQKDFRATHQDTYATSVHSDAGQHNGLYWSVTEGEPRSPLGPLVASAVLRPESREPAMPYRGYAYRLLPSQGKDFTFVAYPVAYRSSGIMTFLVNEKGIVYEKDLGRGTVRLAKTLAAARFDGTWKKAEDKPE